MVSEAAEVIVEVLEAAGIGIITLGVVLATIMFAYRLRTQEFARSFRQYRLGLGRGIVLGLEVLIAADIVRTAVVEPTFSNVGVLGLIVLIRTFLSMALELELEGQWPWQRGTGNSSLG